MHNGSSLGVRDDRRGGLGQGRRHLGSGPAELTFLLPGARIGLRTTPQVN